MSRKKSLMCWLGFHEWCYNVTYFGRWYFCNNCTSTKEDDAWYT